MLPYEKDINKIRSQLIEKFNPIDIILFGSCAKKRVRRGSDIDLCIIISTKNKRETTMEMYLAIESDIDIDFVLFTPDEWLTYKEDLTTFAGLIHRTGVSILDRYSEI
ncbi:nucleotidyltransferase domain-containing protein [Heliorestis convoluta]|uniref:Nucleotidyltransferase domain-containing protein n=1 Tax=Heliorestis convoluta TaxID=356322 RepID=A0A5Q2MYI9_9FIRM|nr:nucleotidyltransferase domain-containing protein [Heliorestis convoluta]